MMRRAQPWLGTLVEISIADSIDGNDSACAFHQAFASIARIHHLLNFHDPASDVLRINRAPVGESIEIDSCTADVLRAAFSISDASSGVFDIACAPRLVEWGYLPKTDQDPPQYIPGCRALHLENENRVRKTGAAWIDLGGIAKGYAVDKAIEALKQAGILSACVNAGGDLRAFGELSYPVGIRDPHAPASIAMQISIRDEALATSACYFSATQIDGQAISALVNGRTGQALAGDFSVSVRAPTCMLADALTKVVAATANPRHPALEQFAAAAFII